MSDTTRPCRTSGAVTAVPGHRPRDRDERQAEAERVGDQEDRALGDRAGRGGHREDPAEDDADARRPADGEDRPEPERREPATLRIDEPAAQAIGHARVRGTGAGRRERHRAGDRGEGLRRPGVQGPPRSLEGRDRQDPGEREAHDDEDQPTDDPQGREEVRQGPGQERRRDAEDREDDPESRDVREGVPDGRPARWRDAVLGRRDGDGRHLAEVRGDERQHARRQEADHTRSDGDEHREFRPGHPLSPGRR